MATGLFITINDLTKNTAMSGNIDRNKLLPAIKTVQLIELEPILGTDLYSKISTDIIEGTLTGVYESLNQDYIHDFLIHAALAYYLPYASYIISNGGVSKHTGGENHDGISLNELIFLQNKEENLAESFKKRLIDYLCANSKDFPEYSTNTGTDISPTKVTNLTNWYLN